jgi:hypothetical protein
MYCEPCKKLRKKIFDHNAMEKFREKAREKRKAERVELLNLIEENTILREELAELRARMGIEERGLK